MVQIRRMDAISRSSSPPLSAMIPLGSPLIGVLLMFLRDTFMRSTRGMTARVTMKSYLSLMSSTRE